MSCNCRKEATAAAGAAPQLWERHNSRIHHGLDSRVWLELANETDKSLYWWQGDLFYQIARDFILPAGRRICVPGSNSGEPESWDGWEDYLRLAAAHPETRLGII